MSPCILTIANTSKAASSATHSVSTSDPDSVSRIANEQFDIFLALKGEDYRFQSLEKKGVLQSKKVDGRTTV